MALFADLDPHSCIHCQELVFDFRKTGNEAHRESQEQRFKRLKWINLDEIDEEKDTNSGLDWNELQSYLAIEPDARLSIPDFLRQQYLFVFDQGSTTPYEKAKDGCLLFQRFFGEFGNLYFLPLADAECFTPFCPMEPCPPLIAQLAAGPDSRITIGTPCLRHKKGPVSSDWDTMHIFFKGGTRFWVGTDAAETVSNSYQRRAINPDPGSDKSLRLCNDWHQACRKTCPYEGDRINSELALPRYLLEISQYLEESSVRLRLVESKPGRPYSYAALSYSWGKPPHLFQTTKENRPGHFDNIDIISLPWSIKDAITVTCHLELKYLWVDALCIFQDDVGFKETEIPKMADIYSNATVTIIASRAENVYQGFLHEREECENLQYTIIQVGFADWRDGRNHAPSPLYLLPGPRPRFDDQPLSTRSWALQERLLSTHVLDFGWRDTTWYCQNQLLLGGKPLYRDGWQPDLSDTQREEKFFSIAQRFKKLPQNSTLSSSDKILEWQGLIEIYTRRELSKTSDRLPAISSVASRYGLISPDDYLAGLWRSILPVELGWETSLTGWYMNDISPLMISKPRRPTWSWVSIDTAVNWQYDKVCWDTMVNWKYDKDVDIDASFEVESCQVEHSITSRSHFGEVNGGVLKVKAKIGAGNLDFSEVFECSKEHPLQYRDGKVKLDDKDYGKCDLGDSPYMRISYDTRGTIYQPLIPISFIIIGIRSRDSHQVSWGLVLQQDANGQYSRIGLFEIKSKEELEHWLLQLEIRSIEII